MNILVVHEVDWLNKVVYDVHEFPELLSMRGHQVVFIDYEESPKRRGATDLVRRRTRVRQNVHRLYPEASIEVRTPGLVKIPGLDRLSSLFTQFFEVRETIRKRHIDVVLLYAMPTSGLSAILAARRAGVPVVYRAIDVLHRLRPQPVSSGIWLAEKIGVPRVDRIAALTPRMASYVCSMGASPSAVTVIPTGMDTSRFHPAPRDSEVAQRYGLAESDRIAMFLGTLYEFAGLDHVIRHWPYVLERVPNAKLLIVGGGDDQIRLENIARRAGVSEKVVFTGMQPIQALPDLINAADVTFNSFRRSKLTDAVLPEKVPRYMACAKPVVCTPLTAAVDLLGGEANGVVFRELEDGFMAAIADLFGDAQRRNDMGQAALSYVEREHDWDVLAARMESLLAETVENGASSRI